MVNKCYIIHRDYYFRSKSALEDAIQKGIPSMSLAKLREKNKKLHDLLRA